MEANCAQPHPPLPPAHGVRESLRRGNNDEGYPKDKRPRVIISADGLRPDARIPGWANGAVRIKLKRPF